MVKSKNNWKVGKLISLIQNSLTPELLSNEWKNQSSPLEGHCYVAAEALYHLLKDKSWKPMVASYKEGNKKATHWWLEHRTTKEIADPTREQYLPGNPPYEIGRGSGFLTKKPSKRARIVMERVKKYSK